jgi:tetratricopeptide (TPR) repeat protein
MRKIINFNLFAFLCIALFSFALYAPSLKYNFTGLDDADLVINASGKTFAARTVFNYFTETVFNNSTDKFYRPLLMLTFYTDALITQSNAFVYDFTSDADYSMIEASSGVYHFTNILLHVLALYGIFLLFTVLGFDKKLTFLGVLIFCVHPAFTQAVVWIPGRNDTLLTFTSTISLFFLCKYTVLNKNKFLFLSVLFYIASLFTKETAVALIPAFAAVIFVFFKNKLNKQNIYKFCGFFAFATLVYFALRYDALKGTGQHVELAASFKLFTAALPSLLNYFEYLIIPVNIAVVPDVIKFNTLTYVSAGITFFICISAFFTRGARKLVILLGIAWFILFLAPTFIMPYNKYFSHRLYLPCIGILMVFLEMVSAWLKNRKRFTRVVYAFMAGIIILCLPLAMGQSEKFSSKQVFWANAVSEMPDSHFVRGSVAAVYHDLGHYDQAREEFFKALRLNSKYWRHYLNLGVTYVKLGDLENAEKCFLEAINFNEFADAAYYNLAQIYDKKENDLQKALQYARTAHNILPKDKGYIEYIETLEAKIREKSNNN